MYSIFLSIIQSIYSEWEWNAAFKLLYRDHYHAYLFFYSIYILEIVNFFNIHFKGLFDKEFRGHFVKIDIEMMYNSYGFSFFY